MGVRENRTICIDENRPNQSTDIARGIIYLHRYFFRNSERSENLPNFNFFSSSVQKVPHRNQFAIFLLRGRRLVLKCPVLWTF